MSEYLRNPFLLAAQARYQPHLVEGCVVVVVRDVDAGASARLLVAFEVGEVVDVAPRDDLRFLRHAVPPVHRHRSGCGINNTIFRTIEEVDYGGRIE